MWKLSKDQKEEVCRLYKSGISSPLIAAEFGVTPPAIRGVLARRSIERRSQHEAQRRHSLNESAFDVITEESAYWIGFLMADGNISIRKTGSPELALVLANKDRQHIEKFRAFLKSTHALIDVPSGKATRFSVRSRKLVEALAKYGVKPNKSFTACAPDILKMNPVFWRGVIDGDGWINLSEWRNGYYKASLQLTGSYSLLSQFRVFVLGFYPDTKAAVCKHKNVYSFQLSWNAAQAVVSILYKDCNVALTRKLKKAQRIMDYIRPLN